MKQKHAPNKIYEFESNVKSFYRCGASSFFTNVEIGDDETSIYMPYVTTFQLFLNKPGTITDVIYN